MPEFKSQGYLGLLVQKNFFAQALTVSPNLATIGLHPLQTHRRLDDRRIDDNDAKDSLQHTRSCSASKTVTLHPVLTVCANLSEEITITETSAE